MTTHTQKASMAMSDDELVAKLRDLVDNQEGGDAVVLVQRQLFNRVVGRLAARIRETGAGRVRVKPLEWEKYNPEEFRAFTPFGTYWCGRSGWSYTDGDWQPGDFATAQADYEARILSTLTQPQADEVTEEMVADGYAAFVGASEWQDWDEDEIKSLVRAALLAALQAEGGE
jgi:RNase P/RNase MRP subunit POP5